MAFEAYAVEGFGRSGDGRMNSRPRAPNDPNVIDVHIVGKGGLLAEHCGSAVAPHLDRGGESGCPAHLIRVGQLCEKDAPRGTHRQGGQTRPHFVPEYVATDIREPEITTTDGREAEVPTERLFDSEAVETIVDIDFSHKRNLAPFDFEVSERLGAGKDHAWRVLEASVTTARVNHHSQLS